MVPVLQVLIRARETTLVFYGDNRFNGSHSPTVVQQKLDAFTKSFKQFGFRMSIDKSEAITQLDSKPLHWISEEAYTRQITGEGFTHKATQQTKVTCKFWREKYIEKITRTTPSCKKMYQYQKDKC
jgi:hypothetical protein